MVNRALLILLLYALPAFAGETTLNGHKFTLPEGFEIQLVAGPPLVSRPITADFDEQGRLYVTESSGTNDKVQKQLEDKPHRVLRLEDKDGDGVFDTSIVFADRMMFPEGSLWHDGSLYVAAPPSIWKLTDTDGDGVADERSEWFQGQTLTGCANDLHGPYLGPDGWIYWCKGAFAEQTYTLGGKEWKTKASHIFRCRPDGTGLEPVMTGGMDNPVDTVFMPNGDRIFTTTFFQYPANGQRDGIIHAIYGGVYGKPHGVLEGHPRTGELMPVLAHTGASAPCGLTRYESDVFGKDYRDNLFASQFNLKKITRHVLTPAGASYTSQDSDFVVSNNHDFHPTDVLADADGSLVIVDTGGWYKLCCPTSQLWKPDVLGAIYRVRRTGAKLLIDSRGMHVRWAELSESELAHRMDDFRPAIRWRAVTEFARRSRSPQFKESPYPRSHSVAVVWALVQSDRSELRWQIRAALSNPSQEVRQAALHGISLHRDAEAAPQLTMLLHTGTPTDRRGAAEALGRIGDRSAVPDLLEAAANVGWDKLAQQAPAHQKQPSTNGGPSAAGAALSHPTIDRALEHSIIYALIELADPAATAKGMASDSPTTQRAALIALDQMPGGSLKPEDIATRLSSPEPLVKSAAQWIISHRPEWGGALAGWCREQLGQIADSTSESAAAQLESQLVQFAGQPTIQDLLAQSVAQSTFTPSARRLALRAMSAARPKELPPTWADALAQIIEGGDGDLLTVAVLAARNVPPQKATFAHLNEALLAAAGSVDASTQTRLDALAAVFGGLPQVSPAQFDFLLASLALEHPLVMRTAAADALSQARLSPEQLDHLIKAIRTAGPLELDRLIAPFERAKDEVLALKLLASLKQATSLPSLRIDTLRLRLAKYPPAVVAAIDELHTLVNVDASAQRARIAELLPSVASGDVRRGQAVFNSTKSACIACHRFGYLGGSSGPDLTRIGQIRNERDLLESILYPSLSFVRSYEPVIVQTSDGRTINGLVRNETSIEITLATGPNQEVRLRRDEIDEMQPSQVSIMPAGLDKQLSVQELLDLVAFLKNAK